MVTSRLNIALKAEGNTWSKEKNILRKLSTGLNLKLPYPLPREDAITKPINKPVLPR